MTVKMNVLSPVAMAVHMAVSNGWRRMRTIVTVCMLASLAVVVTAAGRVAPELPK